MWHSPFATSVAAPCGRRSRRSLAANYLYLMNAALIWFSLAWPLSPIGTCEPFFWGAPKKMFAPKKCYRRFPKQGKNGQISPKMPKNPRGPGGRHGVGKNIFCFPPKKGQIKKHFFQFDQYFQIKLFFYYFPPQKSPKSRGPT